MEFAYYLNSFFYVFQIFLKHRITTLYENFWCPIITDWMKSNPFIQ